MRLSVFVSVFALPALVAVSHGARAHHSFAAEFVPDSHVEITGVVTRVWFSNPHARYRVEVKDENGGTEEWELQLTSVTNLRNAQWFADTLAVGDTITAQGEMGRDGAKKIYVRGVETEDGRELLAYGNRRAPAEPAEQRPAESYAYGQLNKDAPFDISGPWSNSYKFQLTVDDLDPKPTPFTSEGRALYEQVEHYDDYSLRCLAPGLPRIIGAPYNMEIVDAGSHYLVVHVEHNMPRRIFMDGREPPADTQPSSLGYSVGHWEGDTLIIETTHLLPGWLDGSGLPMSGDGTRIVERWDFADDRLTMDRTMTVYDPYYTKPLVRHRGSRRGPDVQVWEMASCDPQSHYRDLYEAGRIEEYLYE